MKAWKAGSSGCGHTSVLDGGPECVLEKTCPELKLFPDELTLFIFDAVRELLMNVAKHAGVKAATVEVSSLEEDWVQVEVRDEGSGFDPAQPDDRKFGLFSIRERADALGGKLEIRSEPGRGTRIALLLSLRDPQAG